MLLLALAAPATAVEEVTPARVEGPNRFATAAATADLAHPQGTTRAVIASSAADEDVLAATPLAGALDAAVLLTRPDELPAETAQALEGLGVEEVTIIGGEHAVNPSVSAALQADYEVARIGGERLYATARNVADQVVAAAGGIPQLPEGPTIALASGEGLPDALSFSTAAYASAMPVLYTDGNTLHPEVTGFLNEHEVAHVVVLGGTAAIPANIEAELEFRGYLTTRLQGDTRVETSQAVAGWTAQRVGFDLTSALLARGDELADAVTAGQVGGTYGSPVLLAATPTILPDTAAGWFAANCPTIETVRAVGGTSAVSIAVLDAAVTAAESCASPSPEPPEIPEPQDGQTYIVTPQQAVEAETATTIDLEVIGRNDEQPFVGPIDVVLFPCSTADVVGAGPDTFVDADGDGGADGFGTTDTGNARVAIVNDVDIDDTTVVVGAEPAADGQLHLTLYSAEPDCTIPVVIDGNGNGQFDVDAEGRPLEPYGVGATSWQ